MEIINGIKLYDTKDLQDLLGVVPSTISNYRKRGLLPSVRVGRRVYTSEAALMDFLKGKTTQEVQESKQGGQLQ